jgi:hypothetical protein
MGSTYIECGCVYRSDVGLERPCQKHGDLLKAVEDVVGLMESDKSNDWSVEAQALRHAVDAIRYDDDSTYLRALAQNDYTIDGRLLPDGVRLMALADKLASRRT